MGMKNFPLSLRLALETSLSCHVVSIILCRNNIVYIEGLSLAMMEGTPIFREKMPGERVHLSYEMIIYGDTGS